MEESSAATTQNSPEFPLEKTEEGYEAGLLWRSEERPFDNSFQAKAVAEQLAERLRAKGAWEAYDDVQVKEYRSLNAIELEPEPETPEYYLLHQAVFCPNATPKTSVVFTASSSPGKPSLNDCVDTGPSLLLDLCSMLLRFDFVTMKVLPMLILERHFSLFLSKKVTGPTFDENDKLKV